MELIRKTQAIEKMLPHCDISTIRSSSFEKSIKSLVSIVNPVNVILNEEDPCLVFNYRNTKLYNGKNKHLYLLQNRLRCSCGSPMYCGVCPSENIKYFCANRYNQKTIDAECNGNRNIDGLEFHDIFWNNIMEPNLFEMFCNIVPTLISEMYSCCQSQFKMLTRKKAEEVFGDIDMHNTLTKGGLLVSELKNYMDKLLSRNHRDAIISERIIHKFRDKLLSAEDSVKRAMILQFVKHVIVDISLEYRHKHYVVETTLI